MLSRCSLGLLVLSVLIAPAAAAVVGTTGPDDLVLAVGGKSQATILVSPQAGAWEKQAAADLAKYLEQMTGAKVAVADSDAAIGQARAGKGPLVSVGQLALQADRALSAALAGVAKKNPVLRSDAIVLRRRGRDVLLAGTNDDAHYYAVAEFLHRLGCRWYLPTEFGECIPQHAEVKVGKLDLAYSPPFEVRRYWLSWNGDQTGRAEFMHRNRFNDEYVPSGHALGKYTKELSKNPFQIPLADPKTAQHVAGKIDAAFAVGKRVSLGMEDGVYQSDSPEDQRLKANLFDKYFQSPMLTDAYLAMCNNVAGQLLKQHPDSQAKIGFLAYSNLTIPPQRAFTAARPLVAYLAPIDIDPIHGMDNPHAPARQEYRAILNRWAEVMQGRVVIYDYDQGMLVWRDFPAPSHQAFRHDVKHYRDAGILGVDTESRGAMATTFLNLFFRGQLLWNPDADVDVLLAEFYPNFYGPAAEPMKSYWSAVYQAWAETLVTEHEHFVVPAIYTPELVSQLKTQLAAAEKAVAPLAAKTNVSSQEKQYVERVQFTRLSFDILDAYTAMIHAAAAEVDYAQAVAAGERGLATREKLTDMNGTFTTYRKIGEHGPAWWPGEVEQYRNLQQLTDGTKGKLLIKLPLEWQFRRDPHDAGLVSGWARTQPDLSWWEGHSDLVPLKRHRQNPAQWEPVRTDRYLQAQGILWRDYHPYQGYGWYHVSFELPAADAKQNLSLHFPGLFNECWLYVNGDLVAHRTQQALWWRNDYRFEWDVDLSSHLKPGQNTLVLRIHNPHHMGGIFRRPFLYVPQ